MIQQRIVDSVQAKDEPKHECAEQSDPKLHQRPLNVQYLLTKKFRNMPETVAANQTRWLPATCMGPLRNHETASPKSNAIKETVRNWAPSRPGWPLERNVQTRLNV